MSVIVVVVIIVVGAGSIWLMTRRRKPARPVTSRQPTQVTQSSGDDPLRQEFTSGDPHSLKPGDFIEWPETGERVPIRGTATFVQGHYTWREHFVEVNGEKCYVSVEDEGDVVVVIWRARPDVQIKPGRETLYFGATFKLDEHARATYTTVGTTDLARSGTVNFYDYSAPGGQRLSFEQFDGGAWEISTGQVFDGQLTIYSPT